MFNNNNNNNLNLNKPPAFPFSHPTAPEQNTYNWNVNNEANAVMLFNGLPANDNDSSPSNAVPGSSPVPSTSGFFVRQPRVKRKSESDDIIPSKHFISEEKMVAHMNGLHLSDNFQSHNINAEDESDQDEAAASSSYNVNLSPQELEQRLKNAQRITVCDQVRKSLREESEIIPKLLLNRIERPCTALILWRPPEPLENLLTGFESKVSDSDEEGIEMDNNNNNNSMDMDL